MINADETVHGSESTSKLKYHRANL
eukprot:COSAG03_NODE_8619_length_787_cov_0.973837_1_plen_24_part_10